MKQSILFLLLLIDELYYPQQAIRFSHSHLPALPPSLPPSLSLPPSVHLEKFLAFVRLLLENWRALDVSHSLSVVFFTRLYYHPPPSPSSSPSSPPSSTGGREGVREGTVEEGEEGPSSSGLPPFLRRSKHAIPVPSYSSSSSSPSSMASAAAHMGVSLPFPSSLPSSSSPLFSSTASATVAASPPPVSPHPSFGHRQRIIDGEVGPSPSSLPSSLPAATPPSSFPYGAAATGSR